MVYVDLRLSEGWLQIAPLNVAFQGEEAILSHIYNDPLVGLLDRPWPADQLYFCILCHLGREPIALVVG